MKFLRFSLPLLAIACVGVGCAPERVRVPEPSLIVTPTSTPVPEPTPPPPTPPGEKLQILLQSATGTVDILTSSSTWIAAKTGDTLNPGDHIRTGKKSQATILYYTRSTMRLDEETEMTIQTDTAVDLQNPRKQTVDVETTHGRIWTRALKLLDAGSSVKVSHGHVVATVRGTAFNFDAKKNGTDIDVIEHAVNVEQDGQQTEVAEGYSIDLKPNGNKDLAKDVKKTADISKNPWFLMNEKQDVQFVAEQGAAWTAFAKDEGFFDPVFDTSPAPLPEPVRVPVTTTPTTPQGPTSAPHVNGPTAIIPPPTPIALQTNATLVIEPTAPRTFTQIEVVNSPNDAASDTVKFSAYAHYSDGTKEDVTTQATWRVETAGAGTISNGLLTMAAQTPDVIYVSATWNGKKGTGSVAVYFGPPR